jgi:hypothetical protein
MNVHIINGDARTALGEIRPGSIQTCDWRTTREDLCQVRME